MSLTKDFIKKQQTSLLAEKEKLEAKIKSLKKYPDYGDQDDDNTMELVDFENNSSLEEGLEKTLKQVKKALKAIEAGTYGQCAGCKTLIEGARLNSMPYAEVCVTCKNKTR